MAAIWLQKEEKGGKMGCGQLGGRGISNQGCCISVQAEGRGEGCGHGWVCGQEAEPKRGSYGRKWGMVFLV